MSHSTLYLVYKTRVKTLATFQNSFGTSTPLWNHLTVKYLERELGSWLWEDNTQWLWDAAEDVRIPEHLRIAHMFTFDMALCTPKNLDRLAEACRKTEGDLATGGKLNHWGAIGLAIKEAKLDSKCLGIGLTGTSVNDIWQQYPKNGREPWDMFGWFDSLGEQKNGT